MERGTEIRSLKEERTTTIVDQRIKETTSPRQGIITTRRIGRMGIRQLIIGGFSRRLETKIPLQHVVTSGKIILVSAAKGR